MTSEFARHALLARQAVDAVHGEAAIFKPMDRAKGPHGARTPSASRPEASIVVAFFHDTEREARLRAQPMLGQSGDRMVNRSPEILGSTAYRGDMQPNDRLLRQDTGVLFEIVTLDRDGIGNTILGLAATVNG